MMNDVLTRFELSFEGENQGTGIFHGIGDIGLPEDIEQAIIKPFEEQLPIPNEIIFGEKGSLIKTKSYFKPEGLQKFEKELQTLKEAIESCLFDVDKIEISLSNVSLEDIVYQDEYQMLIMDK